MKTKILAMLFALVALAGQAKEKTIVWEQPTIEYNNYCGDGTSSLNLDVTKVELKAAETLVYITMKRSLYPEYWFKFVSDTYLKVGDKRYTVVSADGIELDKQEYGGKRDIVFHFPPLPKDTKAFDFIEGDGEGAFQVKGIKPVEERWKQLLPSCWRDDQTGEWKIAFFENYAIYDCKFWDYQQCDVNPKTGEAKMVMSNGDDELTVIVGKDKKGARTLQIGNQTVACSMITSRFLPDYPTKDMSTSFRDNGFHKGDSVTLVGVVRSEDKKIEKVKFWSAFTDLYEGAFFATSEYEAAVDSLGRFQVTIPVVNLTNLYLLQWPVGGFIVEPGETYFIMWDAKNGQTLVMGEHARLQNEMIAHEVPHSFHRPESEEETTAEEWVSYIDVCKKGIADELVALDSVLTSAPTLSERYRIQAETDARLGVSTWFVGRFMDYPFWEQEMPAEVINYTNESLLPHLNESLISTDAANAFFSYYTSMMCEATSPHEINYWASSAEEAHEQSMLIMLKPFYEYVKDMKLSPFFKSLMLTRVLNNNMNESLYPLPAKAMAWVDEVVTVPALHDCVVAMHKKYTEIRKLGLVATKSLHSADELEGVSEGESLLAKLIEPYQGKFVYLDIWGSWCGPCMAALKESHVLKEALKDHDIIYLYLANNTSDEDWKTIINAYGLTGDNIVHYNLPEQQQRAIEEFLQVDGFPFYRLFDKNGKLYDVDADARHVENMQHFFETVDGK